jgi:hypothetical protein
MPDGSDPAQYRWLVSLDRPGWAWEWLRRDAAYVGQVSAGAPLNGEGPIILEEAPDTVRGLLFRRRSLDAGLACTHFVRRSD